MLPMYDNDCVILTSNSEGDVLELKKSDDGRFILSMQAVLGSKTIITSIYLSVADMKDLKLNIAQIQAC
jgi:hypothetical protein